MVERRTIFLEDDIEEHMMKISQKFGIMIVTKKRVFVSQILKIDYDTGRKLKITILYFQRIGYRYHMKTER